jgi:hypothetical protein
MNKNIHLISLFWLLHISLVFAQGDPFLRIELETKSDEATYRVIPCEKNGLIIFYQTNLIENDYNFWGFVHYDRFLQETWRMDIPLFENMGFEKFILKEDFVYAFFHKAQLKKNDIYNYQLLKLHIKKGTYEMFSGLVPDEAEFVSFDLLNDLVVSGFNLKDSHCGIYSFNLQSKESNTVYEELENASEFESFYTNEEANNFIAIINKYVDKSNHFLELKNFDENGVVKNNIMIKPGPGKKFNTGKISLVRGNTPLVFGTYDFINGESIKQANYFENSTSGFFAVNLMNKDNFDIKYQDFLDLENMTGYLKSPEYLEAKRKAEKSNDTTGKHSVSYNIMLHDVIEHDSLFYFIGEGFYEDYHMVTNTYYDYYGRPVPVTYSVFDGYRYFNAFISCYNEQGDKLWDNGMEIFNILTFDLKKRVIAYFTGNETVLAYNHNGKISAKIIKGSEVVEGVEHYPVETTFVNDKIIEDTKSNMVPWYDHYFIAYGFQTIRNNSLIQNNKRTVFYINKVGFQ